MVDFKIHEKVWQRCQDHQVWIDVNPHTANGSQVVTHVAALRCRTCNNRFLKWLKRSELAALQDVVETQ